MRTVANSCTQQVMLIDLDKWRAEDIIPRFASCIQEHSGRVPYVDQGCINEVYRGDIVTLPLRYNVYTLLYDFTYEEAEAFQREPCTYTRKESEDAKRHPTVVHFTSSFHSRRPWIEESGSSLCEGMGVHSGKNTLGWYTEADLSS